MFYLEIFYPMTLGRVSFIIKNKESSFAIIEKNIFYTNAYYSFIKEKNRTLI